MRTNGRYGRFVAAGAALSAVLLALLTSCAPVARYRVLTFFFDGVPAPPGVEPAEKIAPPMEEALSFRDRYPRARLVSAKPTPSPTLSIHEPVREHRCGECHVSAGRMNMLTVDARMCDKCHYEQRVREGWDHGPINLGACIPCHRAHDSPYEHLLERPVPELCMTCHQEDMNRGEEYHLVPNVDRCIECHDPHQMY
jgi:predicted CXXCH cytochrome family protein